MSKKRHCHPFQSLCGGKRGYACDNTVYIPRDDEDPKQTLIDHIKKCIQRLEAGQREITTFHIGRTYIPDKIGAYRPGNPQRLSVKGISDHWQTRKYQKDGIVVLTVFSHDNLPAMLNASPQGPPNLSVRQDASLEGYASLLVEQLREDFKKKQDPRLENKDLTAGVRCARNHPRSAIFLAYISRLHPRNCCTFPALRDGQRGYACDRTVGVPHHTGIEEAKEVLIGHTDHCIQDLQERRGKITTFYIGGTYVPDNRGDDLLMNPQGWNMEGIVQTWERRMNKMEGLVALAVVSQDNLPEKWSGTPEDYASYLAVGLVGHCMEKGCNAKLDDYNLHMGRRANVQHPKYALFMAFSFWHPMDMDIANMMRRMFG